MARAIAAMLDARRFIRFLRWLFCAPQCPHCGGKMAEIPYTGDYSCPACKDLSPPR